MTFDTKTYVEVEVTILSFLSNFDFLYFSEPSYLNLHDNKNCSNTNISFFFHKKEIPTNRKALGYDFFGVIQK